MICKNAYNKISYHKNVIAQLSASLSIQQTIVNA